MTKSFVERLTDEQIRSFVDELYPKKQGFEHAFYFSPEGSYGKTCICVVVSNINNNFMHTFKLEDFDAQVFNTNKWLNYLHNIFGDEYVKSFIEDCLSVFEDNDEH